MNILKKIGLSFLVIIIAILTQGLLAQLGGTRTGGVRLIPGALMVLGLIYVWTRKFNKK